MSSKGIMLRDRMEFEGSRTDSTSRASTSTELPSSPSSPRASCDKPFAAIDLKEPEVDEGIEARVLCATNNPVRSFSRLITPINLGVHSLGPPPSSSVLKREQSKTKGNETSKFISFSFSFMDKSSYVLGMKKPSREGLAKLKATGKKVVHMNPKKRKTVSKASSLDAGVITSLNPEPLSLPIMFLSDESVHTPPLSSKEKEKEVHSVPRETGSPRPLMIHDNPKAFCEFAAYETHVTNQNMRFEATKLAVDLKGSEEIISNLRDKLKVEKAGTFAKADQITGLEAHVKTLEMTLSSAKVDAVNEFVARDEYHRTTCKYFDSGFEDFRRCLQADFLKLDLSKYQTDDNIGSILMGGDDQAPGDDQEYDATS
ncbi:hypothetical protein FCV25MIE_15242 [Fagus crenata]